MLVKRKAKMSESHTVTGRITAPVTIQASAAVDGVAQLGKFDGIAYSGGRVRGTSIFPPIAGDYVLNLAGLSAVEQQMKANLDHEDHQRVGHVTDFQNNGQALQLAGLLSAETSYRNEVLGSAKNDYAFEMSIEAELGPGRRLPKGKSEMINGQTFTGPLTIFDQSVLTGVAFVSRGADKGNRARIAASAAKKGNHMDPFEQYVTEELEMDFSTLTEPQRAKLKATWEGASRTPTTGKTGFKAIAEEERKEQLRIDGISRVAASVMKEHPLYVDEIEKWVEEGEKAHMSVDAFELDLYRKTRNLPSIDTRRGKQENPKVIECAVAMSAGLPNIEKHYNENVIDAVERSGMQNFGLQQLLITAAHANGYTCRLGERIHMGNVRDVLDWALPPRTARMAVSTINLPGILGNVANKEILEGYKEEDPTWELISTVKNVTNFFERSYFRMLDNLEYEEVGSGGELTHGSLGQESVTAKPNLFGKMLGLSLENILNDEAGAFDDIRTRLGMGGHRAFQRLFWRKFMDNAAHFTSARGNYIEGASTALDINGTGLEAAILAYGAMKSPVADGEKEVGAMGKARLLLVPDSLQFIAQRLFQSTTVNTGGAATDTTVGNANVHAGQYQPVVQTRLDDTAYTGNSNKAFYLLGTVLKAMLVQFLNGQRTPVIQQADADFDQLGIQFRGYHIFGASLFEYLCGVKSKGEN